MNHPLNTIQDPARKAVLQAKYGFRYCNYFTRNICWDNFTLDKVKKNSTEQNEFCSQERKLTDKHEKSSEIFDLQKS